MRWIVRWNPTPATRRNCLESKGVVKGPSLGVSTYAHMCCPSCTLAVKAASQPDTRYPAPPHLRPPRSSPHTELPESPPQDHMTLNTGKEHNATLHSDRHSITLGGPGSRGAITLTDSLTTRCFGRWYVSYVKLVSVCRHGCVSNSVKVVTKFHLEWKLRCSCVTHLMLRQMHLTHLSVSIEAKYWVSWLYLDKRTCERAMKAAFEFVISYNKRWIEIEVAAWQRKRSISVLCRLTDF